MKVIIVFRDENKLETGDTVYHVEGVFLNKDDAKNLVYNLNDAYKDDYIHTEEYEVIDDPPRDMLYLLATKDTLNERLDALAHLSGRFSFFSPEGLIIDKEIFEIKMKLGDINYAMEKLMKKEHKDVEEQDILYDPSNRMG